MPLEFLVKQMLGEITLPQSMKKTQKTEIKQPIIFKCYAHIMNNHHIGMTKKNKTDDSDNSDEDKNETAVSNKCLLKFKK